MRRAALLLPLCLTACAEPTGTLDVVLRTELEAGDAFTRVRSELFDALPEEGGNYSDRPQEIEVADGMDYASGQRIAQFGPLIAGAWAIRVQLITRGGRVLATRVVRVEVEGTTRAIVELGPDDLIEGAAPCAEGVDADTLALYTFDGDEGGTTITDSTGTHHGTTMGGDVQVVPGPDGCDDALLVPDTADAWASIPDSGDFDLERGSIDFWVRPHVLIEGYVQGIVSRDALGTDQPGHLTVYFAPDGRVVARLQNPDGEAHRCSNEPLELDQWSHVGLNFGPEGFELHVDGTMATRTEPIVIDEMEGRQMDCGGGTVFGIEGNDNPWVLGAAASQSMEGEAEPVDDHFVGGAIDQLRISSARRDFSR